MHLCNNMEQQQRDIMDSSSWKDKRSKGHDLPQFYMNTQCVRRSRYESH